jgi:hypothetical protein
MWADLHSQEDEMVSVKVLLYALVALSGTKMTASDGRGSQLGCDTVQAGDAAISPKHPQSFTVLRNLLLTRNDTATPFGTQRETLTWGRLSGRPTLLDVLVFSTPRGTTVDSSWVDIHTLRPLRFRSNNTGRAITLDFDGQQVRGRITPSTGTPTEIDQQLGVRAFEWNILGLAVGALPLGAGYCVTVPVYSDRIGKATWYTVEVVGDTTVPRKSRAAEPVWEVLAKAEAPAPTARYWISRRHGVVSRVLVSEPGISIMYARD